MLPTPVFPIPSYLPHWEEHRNSVRRTLWSLLGDLPPLPTTMSATLRSREERDGYTIENLFLANGLGQQIPATLLLPSNISSPCPAVLYCHQHGGAYSVGKAELFLSHPVPEPPGIALVQRGFVVLAVDAPGFGERQGQSTDGKQVKGSQEEWSLAKYYLWQGSTLWGMMLHDDLVGFEYLTSRPEVDSSRIGVTGMSMGSTRSWWLAALEERIACVVGVACLTRYEELVQNGGLHAHGIYYFVPAIMRHFDTEAVVSLIAPRPLLLQLGDSDEGSPVEGAHKILDYCEQVYGLYGASENIASTVVQNLGHLYLPEMWSRTLDWLSQHLQ